LSVSPKNDKEEHKNQRRILLIIGAIVIIDGEDEEEDDGDEPLMHLAFFFDPDCGSCQEALEFLPGVKERYPNLEVHEFDTSNEENFNLSEDFAKTYNVPSEDRIEPMFFIGNHFLVYDESVKVEKLDEVLDIYDGDEVPLWPEWDVRLTMHLVFFYDERCPSCQDAIAFLPEVISEYPNLEVHEYNTKGFDVGYTLMKDFSDAYNIPSGERVEPLFFIGEHYLTSPESTGKDNLTAVLDLYDGRDVPLWPDWNLTWTTQLALFYDPDSSEGQDTLTLVSSLDASHVRLQTYDLSKGLVNETLFEEFLSYYEIDEDDVNSAVFIGKDSFIEDGITFENLNDSIFKNPGVNTQLPEIGLQGDDEGNICVVVFLSPTCADCDEAMRYLNEMELENPEIKVTKFSSKEKDYENWRHSYFDHFDVDEDDRGGFLAVFIGDDHFTTTRDLKEDFPDSLERYEDGVACPDVEYDPDAAESIFKKFTPLLVGLAGLVDGINPCAFATMIFFITYLSSSGRNRKQILAVGISFTVGVFLTYFLLGMGLYRGFQSLSGVDAIASLIYPITGVVALIFGILSLYDYQKIKAQKKGEQVLQLPKPIKKLTGRFIKHQVQVSYLTVLAVFTGIGISLFEFLCTGQIYLPTIIVMTGVSEHQTEATLYLLLYNVMFILPLIVIFTWVYYGSGSDKLQEVLNRRRATIKLLTALMFFVLAGVMFFLSLELYGLI